jgi:ABC-type multidrug transport system fused ATPase/permease subunit
VRCKTRTAQPSANKHCTLQTIIDFDKILVMSDGIVASTPPPQALLSLDPQFHVFSHDSGSKETH